MQVVNTQNRSKLRISKSALIKKLLAYQAYLNHHDPVDHEQLLDKINGLLRILKPTNNQLGSTIYFSDNSVSNLVKKATAINE